MPYKCQFVEIDPSVAIPAETMNTLRNVYAEDNSYTGLAIEVQNGASAAFWEALGHQLNVLSQAINLKQFALNIETGNTPQDFSNLTRLPFWQNLQAFGVEGPLSESCVYQVAQQLKTQPQLSNLSLSTAGIKTELATTIISNLPPTVEALDLSWNPIEESATASFKAFCQAVKTSRLTSLTLSVKSSAECAALTEALVNVDRQFTVSLWPSPGIIDTDMDYFISAMKKNPYLRFDLNNYLNFLSDPQRLQDLADLCETNKLPSLQHLVALRLADLLKDKTITENDVAHLPEPCIELIPISEDQKAAIITTRQAQIAVAVMDNTLDNSLKKLSI